MYEREINLELARQPPSSKLFSTATFTFYAFRNLFIAQAEQEEVTL